jgi:hypothetical protein
MRKMSITNDDNNLVDSQSTSKAGKHPSWSHFGQVTGMHHSQDSWPVT